MPKRTLAQMESYVQFVEAKAGINNQGSSDPLRVRYRNALIINRNALRTAEQYLGLRHHIDQTLGRRLQLIQNEWEPLDAVYHDVKDYRAFQRLSVLTVLLSAAIELAKRVGVDQRHLQPANLQQFFRDWQTNRVDGGQITIH